MKLKLFGLFFLFTFTNIFASRFYVNVNATGTNTGTSWSNAYTDLQEAISVAIYGDDIWVATGTYKPTSTNNRSISFVLKNGVNIYGGFNGTETLLEQRDSSSNPTTLNGDIGNLGEYTDNSYSIVRATDITTSIFLDGFRLINGNATSGKGGAIRITNSNSGYINIKNCLFYSNRATNYGGAISIENSNINIEKSSFLNNNCNGTGGVIYIFSTGHPSVITINQTDFIGNQSHIGACIASIGTNQNLSIDRCRFTNNYSENDIFDFDHFDYFTMTNSYIIGNTINDFSSTLFFLATDADDDFKIINCTIAHNYNVYSGTIQHEMIKLDSSTDEIYNCIIYGNTPYQGRQIYPFGIISDCLVENGQSNGINIIDDDPLFVNPYTVETQFDATNYDYTISSNSPVINMGNNSHIDTTIFDKDLNNDNRLQQLTIDLGCYETPYNSPLAAICQNATINLDSDGIATLTTSQVDNGSTGDTISLSISQDTFNCDNLGENTVVLTVTDIDNNEDTCSATITVEDNLPPILDTTNLPDIIAQCEVVSWGTIPTATDNCTGTINGVSNVSLPITSQGTTVVTWSYNDGNGNSVSQIQNIVINDTTAPTIIGQNATGNLDGTGSVTIPISSVNNGSYDNCDGAISFTLTPNTFTTEGVFSAVLSGTDNESNTGETTVSITIIDTADTESPNAVCQSYTAYLNSSGVITITANNVDGGSTDNVAIASSTVYPNNFDCDDLGTNSVTLTVTDTSGNTDSCTATVTVVDNINPTAISQNIQLDLASNSSISTTASAIDNGSSDNCGIDLMTISENTFTAIGNYTIDFTVTDTSSNSDTTTANVEVIDSTAGINKQEIKGLEIYPNPTTEKITIKANKQIQNVIISDILGKHIINENPRSTEVNLHLDKLTKGIYIITLKTNNAMSVKIIIKE